MPARTSLGPDFAKVWTASAVSNVGDGVTMIAGPLLVAQLTGDPGLVAGAAFVQQLPWLLLALVSGAYVDRLDRRRLVIVVNLGRSAALAALAAAVATDSVTIPLVYAVFFLLGTGETLVDTAYAPRSPRSARGRPTPPRGLTALHGVISAEAPEWDDHVEVDYVSVEAVEGVLAGDTQEHPMVRISPGEPIHLLLADRHYLLNWRAACDHDHGIIGRSPVDVLPPISDDPVRAVVIEHAQQWPAWLGDARTPGFQAYAVLTMCRVLAYLRTGRQWSKHKAAVAEQELMPEWRGLISWADDWWYGNGSDMTSHRMSDVTAFVQRASQLAVERYGEEGHSVDDSRQAAIGHVEDHAEIPPVEYDAGVR